jgi:predicted ATPase
MPVDESPAVGAPSLSHAYRLKLTQEGWQEDGAQQGAVAQLSRLLADLRRGGTRRAQGLYLYGPV